MIYPPKERFFSINSNGFVFNKVIKKDIALKILFNESLNFCEDSVFIWQCFFKARTIFVCKDIFYNYNLANESSFTMSSKKGYFQKIGILFKDIDTALKKEMKNPKIWYCLNSFKLKIFIWIISNILVETKSVWTTARICAKNIDNNLLNGISTRGMPFVMKCYFLLLRCRLYVICATGVKFYLSMTDFRNKQNEM